MLKRAGLATVAILTALAAPIPATAQTVAPTVAAADTLNLLTG